mgnify:CR=1 FL=1
MNVQFITPSLFLLPCHMNAPLLLKVLMPPPAADPRSSTVESIPPTIWQSAFGPILIEVRDGAAYVNGKRVLSMAELRDSGSEGLTRRPDCRAT